MQRAWLPALAIAAVGGLLVVPPTYAFLRAYDVLFKQEAEPASDMWSLHVAMFWRLAVSSYLAVLVASLLYLAASRDLPLTTKALGRCVFIAAATIGAQAILWP
jgi:hypothetical protein